MDTAANQNPATEEKSAIARLLRFCVDNAPAITVGAMGFVHAGLLAIFWFSGITPLVMFNVLSVVVYTFCYILCRLGYFMPVYVSIILEVTLYSVISTYFVGLRCGTYCFLFSIIPIIIYFGSILFKGKRRWSVVLMLVLNFATFAIMYIRFFDYPPFYDVAPHVMLILVIFSAFAMVFSVMFYNVIYIYASEHTVNFLEEKNKQLSMDAHEDALTSLLNRRGFLPLIKDAMMEKKGKRFCVAFCDLDDFKRVNDSYGHEAGDAVLLHTTMVIKHELPGSDICRWGGEEFVILMRDCDMATAKGQVERLRKTIESNPTEFVGKQIFATTTIGLAEYDPFLFKSPEMLIKKADERMYYGKQHGKNMVVSEDME